MQAGRELDLLIAEKFFSLHVLDTFTGKKTPISATAVMEMERQRESIPRFSTDIAAAMLVFEKLRRSGQWCCLSIDSDYHHYWEVKLVECNIQRDGTISKDNPKHLPQIVVGDESLPLAICKAALRAIPAHK